MKALKDKIKRKSVDFLKRWKLSKHDRTKLIFIMGYGRSGTRILINLFQYSWNTEVHREKSRKLMKDFMLKKERLLPLVQKSKAEVFVAKPILNSFETEKLLKEHKDLKVIWMIRNYKDVINSAINKFRTEVGDYLKKIVEDDDWSGQNWISQTIPKGMISKIKQLDYAGFSDEDWLALVWFSVNSTLIENDLFKSDRIKVIRYEDFVSEPVKVLHEIERFIGARINKKPAELVFSDSIGKGKHIELHPAIEQMCGEIQKLFLSHICYML